MYIIANGTIYASTKSANIKKVVDNFRVANKNRAPLITHPPYRYTISMPRTGKKALPINGRYQKAISNKGAPSTLSDDIILRIEELVKSGADNQKIIAELGIPESTWYFWLYRDTRDLAQRVGQWRREYLLNLAEDTFVTLAKSKNERIKLQAVLHLSETLGKKFYSKREEHKMIEEGEGEELEPENKERLDKLLKIAIVEKPLQDKAQIENKESAPL